MKKVLLPISVSALLLTTPVWAATTQKLPSLQARYLSKDVVGYTLNKNEGRLLSVLNKKNSHSHLVIIDEKGHLLQRVHGQEGELDFSEKKPGSIRLAQQYYGSSRFNNLTQPLELTKSLPYHFKQGANKQSSQYQTPTDIELSTNVRVADSPCGEGTQSKSCPLYANKYQQIPVFVNFNSAQTATPYQDFNPEDFQPQGSGARLKFEDGSGNVIPLNQWYHGVWIQQAPDGYEYGQVGQQQQTRATQKNLVVKSPQGQENEFFVSFKKYNSERINKTLTLQAVYTAPGSKTSLSSNSSQTNISVLGVQPYAYTASDFEFRKDIVNKHIVEGSLSFNTGYIEMASNNNQLPLINNIEPVRISGQNYIAPLSGGEPSPCVAAGMVGAPSYMSTCSEEYTDGNWINMAVYLGTQTIDPNGNVTALPFYEVHKTLHNTDMNSHLIISFSGNDVYGNPFVQTKALYVKNSTFQWP